jgi:cytochrome c-type biogenesis protein CcmH
VDTHQFDNQAQAMRFHNLILEMRCPKCQNQDLADSDAPIAKDLRNEIAVLISQNKSDADIKNYMVSRYGEFILYKPQFSGYTLIVWLAPIILLLVGLGVVRYIVRSHRKSHVDAFDTKQRMQALKELLADKDNS